MAAADSHPSNGFSADAFSRYIPHQSPNLRAPTNNQREGIPPPGRSVTEPGRMQDLHHANPAYQGIVDYHPQPLANPAYMFPDAGHAQGIPVQPEVRPNVPVDQEHNLYGYGPPHVAPGLVQAAFHHPFVHRVPAPDQPRQAGAENLRQLARHYLQHPDAEVRMITMEAGTAGRIKVAVIFETADI